MYKKDVIEKINSISLEIYQIQKESEKQDSTKLTAIVESMLMIAWQQLDNIAMIIDNSGE